MPRVFIGIGSNINKEKNILSSVTALRDCFGRLEISNVYQTRAVGFEGDDFHNLVVGLDARVSPREIGQTLKRIEADHDRTHGKEQFESRTLDLDQLLYGDLVVQEDGVRLPHPDILRYNFMLRPLAELARDVQHPEEKRTFGELWKAHRMCGEMKRVEYRF